MIEKDYQKTQWTGKGGEREVKRIKVREKVLYEGQRDEKVTQADVCAGGERGPLIQRELDSIRK